MKILRNKVPGGFLGAVLLALVAILPLFMFGNNFSSVLPYEQK